MCGKGVTLDADKRHDEVMVNEMKCGDNTAMTIPTAKAPKEESEDDKLRDLEIKKKKKTKKKNKKKKKKKKRKKNKGKLGNNICNDGAGEVDGEGDALDAVHTNIYRSVVARGNSLSTGRVDVAYAVKECARRMQRPIREDWFKLERLVFYLKCKPMMMQWFRYQDDPQHIQVFTNTD